MTDAAITIGWTHVDCSMNRAVANAEGGEAIAPEVLIVNGPSYTA